MRALFTILAIGQIAAFGHNPKLSRVPEQAVSSAMLANSPRQTTSPAADLERARQFLVSGKPEDAIPIYQQLTRSYPANPDLLLNLCIAEFEAKHYRDAAAHARAVLTLKPDLAAADLFLGSSEMALEQEASAIEPLKKAVEAMPGDANASVLLAEALQKTQNYTEALKYFQRSAELLPRNPRVWYGLGQTYDALASQAENQLRETSPDSSYRWVLEANEYLNQRRFGSAFATYRKALASGPVVRGIHAGLASVYRETGHPNWAAIESDLEAKLALPENGTSGPRAYYDSKSYRSQAAQAYDRLLQLPASLQRYLYAATRLDSEGRYREAAAEWRNALKLAPADLNVQTGLVWALYRSHDYDSILPVLSEILKEKPDSAEANFLYGATLLNLSQPQAAIPYLKAAIQGDPGLRPAAAALGQALLQKGDPEQAIPYLRTAIPDDEDGNAHFQLFRAYQLTGNSGLAHEAFIAYQQFRAALDEKRKMEEGSLITAPNM